MTVEEEYAARLSTAVERYRAKFPDRYAAFEAEAILALSPPLKYRSQGLPAWARTLIEEQVSEAVRQAMKWPTLKEWA